MAYADLFPPFDAGPIDLGLAYDIRMIGHKKLPGSMRKVTEGSSRSFGRFIPFASWKCYICATRGGGRDMGNFFAELKRRHIYRVAAALPLCLARFSSRYGIPIKI